MAILPIRTFPDPVLRRACEEAEPGTERIRRLAADMLETMYAAPGIGLAAPQVGENIRMIAVDVGGTLGSSDPHILLNPKITASSDSVAFEEGCLSLPHIREEVTRPSTVRIEYYDENWNLREEEYDGIRARVIQHEYDHLDGKLFVDKINPIRRKLLTPRLNAISRGKVESEYTIVYPKK